MEFDTNIYAYRFAVLTGLRPGELRALRWENITGRTVKITEDISIKNNCNIGGKNENAVRSFVMSDQAYAVLMEQKEKFPGKDLVFHNIPLSYRTFSNQWSRYCRSNGIPHISLYELRHTFVSINQGLPDSQLKRLVGHSESMDTFGVYSHKVNGEDARIARAVTDIFNEIIPSAQVMSKSDPLKEIRSELERNNLPAESIVIIMDLIDKYTEKKITTLNATP
ncbi:MAG: site-specific integrase [Clostridia bacterium]|nr:site-specific integrase [Clostridia bacterium]